MGYSTSTSTPIAAAIAALVLELAKQLKLDISHDVRLKTLEDMREMFSYMSEQKDGYEFIVSWQLLGKQVGRDKVAFRKLDILYKFFGAEDDPHRQGHVRKQHYGPDRRPEVRDPDDKYLGRPAHKYSLALLA